MRRVWALGFAVVLTLIGSAEIQLGKSSVQRLAADHSARETQLMSATRHTSLPSETLDATHNGADSVLSCTDAILPSVFCICAFSLLSRVGMTERGEERRGEERRGDERRGEERSGRGKRVAGGEISRKRGEDRSTHQRRALVLANDVPGCRR